MARMTAERILDIAARRVFVRGKVTIGPEADDRYVLIWLLAGFKDRDDPGIRYGIRIFEFHHPPDLPNKAHWLRGHERDENGLQAWIQRDVFSEWPSLWFGPEEVVFIKEVNVVGEGRIPLRPVSSASVDVLQYLSRMHAAIWQARGSTVPSHIWTDLIYRRMSALIADQTKVLADTVGLIA